MIASQDENCELGTLRNIIDSHSVVSNKGTDDRSASDSVMHEAIPDETCYASGLNL